MRRARRILQIKEGYCDLLKIYRRFELRNLLLLVVDLGHHTGEKWEWGALNDLPAEIKAQFPLLTLTTPKVKKYLDHCLTFDGFGDRMSQKLPIPGYGRGDLFGPPLDRSHAGGMK